MSTRSYERNLGYVSCPNVDDHKWIVGAVIVLVDENGEVTTRWQSEDWDWVPDIDHQRRLGVEISHAFVEANNRAEPDVDGFIDEVLGV